MNKSVIIYDIEIINPIQPKLKDGLDAYIVYCQSWTDFANMGIACIGAFDYQTNMYHVFLKDNLDQFSKLINDREYIVGYNNLAFDDKVLLANNIGCSAKPWDLLAAIWHSLNEQGLPKKNTGLDPISKANLGALGGKSGDGLEAAKDWQRGKTGKVIDYCLRDVWLTKSLLDMCINEGTIVDANGNILHIEPPFAAPPDQLPF